MPGLFDEISAAGEGVLDERELRRLKDATARAQGSGRRATRTGSTNRWLARQMTGRSGGEEYDELIRLRAFDGLDADAILEIGEQQLAENKAARVRRGARDRPDGRRADRGRPHQARPPRHVRGGARVLPRRHAPRAPAPDRPRHRDRARPTSGSTSSRRPSTCATSSRSRRISSRPSATRSPSGIYVVTPSVDDDPNAMREHNYSARSATPRSTRRTPATTCSCRWRPCIPSLTRLLVDAPEFVEGWGMYSEQMMREQGFDDAANFRLNMYTDAIWRACRIVLDVKMHRGEIGVDDATRFMVEQTSFEEPNARAEVNRYTYTPTYQLSYLLGKVLLLQLRRDEQRAARRRVLPEALPRHAARERQPADLVPPAASARRRAAARPDGVDAVLVIPRSTSTGGRSRIVSWPGAAAGVGAPTDRPDVIAERFVGQGARLVHLVDFDGRENRRAGEPRGGRARRGARRRSDPARRRPRGRRSDPARVRSRRHARRPGDERGRPAAARPRVRRGGRRLAGRGPRSAAGAARRVPVAGRAGRSARRPRSKRSSDASRTSVCDDSSCRTAARGPIRRCCHRSSRTIDADVLVAGGVTDLAGIRALRDAGVHGVILGEPLLSGAIDYHRRPGGRRMTVRAPRPCSSPSPRSLPWPSVPARPLVRPRPRRPPRRGSVGRPRIGAPVGRPCIGSPVGRPAASAPASAAAGSGGTASAACPKSAPAPAANAGQTRTVDDRDAQGQHRDQGRRQARPERDAATSSRSPSAAIYDGVVFHRLVPGFVIQGGDGQSDAAEPERPVGRAARATRSRTSR